MNKEGLLLNEDEIYEIQNEVTCELWHTEFLGEVADLTKAIAKAQAKKILDRAFSFGDTNTLQQLRQDILE